MKKPIEIPKKIENNIFLNQSSDMFNDGLLNEGEAISNKQ